MILNEGAQQYKSLIKEELGIQDETKLNWMAQMAQIHAIHEGLQASGPVANGIYSTPLNTIGMGNPVMPLGTNGGFPTNNGGEFSSPAYVNGSGDVPMSTLSASLEIAAVTIGFDLVPVVPAAGPWAMLTFNDYPYAGGKLGRAGFETPYDGKGDGDENKPIYIKLNASFGDKRDSLRGLKFSDGVEVEVSSANGKIKGTFIGFSRIDDNIIIRVLEVKDAADTENVSIATALSAEATVTLKQKTGILETEVASTVVGWKSTIST